MHDTPHGDQDVMPRGEHVTPHGEEYVMPPGEEYAMPHGEEYAMQHGEEYVMPHGEHVMLQGEPQVENVTPRESMWSFSIGRMSLPGVDATLGACDAGGGGACNSQEF